MNPDNLIPLNPKDFLILFSLVSARRHGYGIVKEVDRESRGAVKLDPANLYRSIKKLIRDGLMQEATEGEAGDGGHERRRYYAITELGRRVVALEAARIAQLAQAAREKNLIPGSESRS